MGRRVAAAGVLALSALLAATAAPAAGSDLATSIVTFAGPPSGEQLEMLAGVGVAVHGFDHVPAAVVVSPPSARSILARLPGVRGVYENRSLRTVLRESTATIGARAAWDLGVTGEGVAVAVIDTGIDGTHADLCAAPEFCVGTAVKTVANVKVVGRQDVAADPVVYVEGLPNTDTSSGHGTHVAGIVGGLGVKSPIEPGRYRGVAPGARLVGLGTGEVLEAVNVLGAYDWAIEHRDAYAIKVINNSWGPGKGTPYDPGDPVNLATDAAWDAGISVVFGAGNDGPATDTMNMFSAHPRAISAAAGTKDGEIAFFSSRGVPGSPLWRPTVTAPGYNIVSVRSSTGFYGDIADATSGQIVEPPDNAFYATSSGTSMAAPHVAGVIALMQQAARDARGAFLTPAQVRDILQNTARAGLPDYQSYTMGAGYVDAAAAVAAARAGTHMDAYDDGVTYDVRAFRGTIGPAALVPTQTFEATIDVAPGARALDVMAEWGVQANDVDIDLFRPSGALQLSTTLRCAPSEEPNGYSSFCTQLPTERITVAAPAAGRWRAVIKGNLSALDTVQGLWSVAYPDGVAPAAVAPAAVSVAPATTTGLVGLGVEVTATVRDAAGLPVPNALVQWSSAGVGAVGHAETVTDARGVVRAVATSGSGGLQTVTATTGAVAGSATIDWLGMDLPLPPTRPQSTPGRASGGGHITVAGVKHTFGFWGEYEQGATRPGGELSFKGHDGTAVAATGVTLFQRSGNGAILEGSATVNGAAGYSFRLEVMDNGTPGKGADTVEIVVTSSTDPLYRYERSGTLAGGNLKVSG